MKSLFHSFQLLSSTTYLDAEQAAFFFASFFQCCMSALTRLVLLLMLPFILFLPMVDY